MIRIVLWWILISIRFCNAADDVTCGTRGVSSAKRVIGGINANKGDWPWQALLLKHKYYQVNEVSPKRAYGGGSIISNKWVLSAAHVFNDDESQTAFRTKRWNRLLVILGLTKYPKLGDPLPDEAFVFEPIDVLRHKNFDSETYDFDIALIKFGRAMKSQGGRFIPNSRIKEIPFGSYVRPVCLPCLNSCGWKSTTFNSSECKEYADSLSPTDKQPSQGVIVTGFGSTLARDPLTMNYDYPENLQQATLSIHSGNSCEAAIQDINKEYASLGYNVIADYTERMLCAGGLVTGTVADSCQGDSGGPLVKKVKSRDGSECWTQVGIVSWGLGCAYEQKSGNLIPGFYVNIASLMEWLLDKIDQLKLPHSAVPAVCPPPTPPKNGFFSKNADKRAVGTAIKSACNQGYRLKGKRISRCLPSIEWEPFPTCEGSWDRWTSWSPCSASCRGRRERRRVCKANKCPGRDKQIRLCNRLECLPMCPQIQPPPNGSMKVVPTPRVLSPGTVVEFFCDEGWKLKDGPNMITCQSNQKWSNEKFPVCEFINKVPVGRTAIFNPDECAAPRTPENGFIVQEKEKYFVGEYILFACNPGFIMTGAKWTQCLGANEFTNDIPICSARTSCLSGCSYINQAACQCHSNCFFEGNCCQDHFVFCNTFPFS